jgi:hypothetical protein
MKPTLSSDRLYGITMRPQELAVYGERVEFSLRYSPIFDHEDETTDTHYKLLVLEISAELSEEDELKRATHGPLLLVKCGWELELKTAAPCRVGTLVELPEELPRLLERVAETVNELARRARLEAPLGPELVASLVARYREDSNENDSQQEAP